MGLLDELHAYQKLMTIAKHRLDDELEIQAEIQYKISDCKVQALSAMLSAKDVMERYEGRLYHELKEDGNKLTVPEIQGIVQSDRTRLTHWQTYQDARHTHDQWEGLYESWRSRGFALRALVDLRIANYYTADSVSAKDSREKDYADSRKALARSRNDAPMGPRRRALV